MANAQRGNLIYVDSTGDLTTDKNIKIQYIIITATAATAILKLADTSDSTVTLDVRLATSGESKQFSFEDYPLLFPNGIEANTVTNCVATIVTSKQGVGGK